MLNSAALAFAWAAQQFDIPTETLKGHRDHSRDTACPGANLYDHVESGELRRRVEDMVAAGPVNLRNICGPRRGSEGRSHRSRRLAISRESPAGALPEAAPTRPSGPTP